MGIFAALGSWLRRNRQFKQIGGEGPRGFVGGLWHELGDLQFRFLVDQGLRPQHVLLDIACGALRGGVRFIPYLECGHYVGVDIDGSLIEHGVKNELGETLSHLKKPEFVVSDSFEFEKLSKRPDFAMAQSLFTHLTEQDILLCMRNLRAIAKDTTRFFATFLEVAVPVENPERSHPHAPFQYTRTQMQQFGEMAKWNMRYIGAWGHPRNQMIVEYSPAISTPRI